MSYGSAQVLIPAAPTEKASVDLAAKFADLPRRKQRWSAFTMAPYVPGVPACIDPRALTPTQLDSLATRVRIEEITHKLVGGMLELGIGPRGRSPSPEPVYDPSSGKRVNTRDVRMRERLAIERQYLINDAAVSCPVFRPPPDFRPVSLKKMRKLYIPIDKWPDYNFVGLIIGPRGKTHRELESETGCKIAIRGKGSARSGRDPHNDADEPLHVQVTADTERQLQMAVRRVSQFLVPTDDDKNVHKQAQLRELAVINGTLRDSSWQPPQMEERTWERAKVKCEHCGETSHPSGDCPFRGTAVAEEYQKQKAQLDAEYSSFLGELGLDGPPAKRANTATSAPPIDPTQAAAQDEYAKFMAELGGGGGGGGGGGAPPPPPQQHMQPPQQQAAQFTQGPAGRALPPQQSSFGGRRQESGW
eukprot:TRINITY_DN182_c0_g1_i1.p2 TRINITY_DN182_c0_g1~~TRINITY_DN182_c0_g1_i1.p2  ORF type:complete len:417 (+),score=163.70 TRINITY_DN182_c0_g1_i1:67-1317(+)